MLSASAAYRAHVAQSSKVLVKATLKLADGTTRYLVGDDFMDGTMAFSDAVSGSGSFDIGTAIMNQFDVQLNNHD